MGTDEQWNAVPSISWWEEQKKEEEYLKQSNPLAAQ